ncbi:MAG: GspMb/PilO family protein [Planctomycetota bacterium]|nr:GspMb/PilO family protein [Planctomycetota bacterium]
MKAYKKYFSTVALIWAGCFTVFFFGYLLFLAPQYSSKKLIENKLSDRRQRHESITKVAQEENRIRAKEEIERLRGRLNDFVIDFEDSANLTFDISQIAGDKKVTAFSIKSKDTGAVSPIPNCEYICESRIEISFTAGFNQFATFLNALERHHPVIFVDSFAISRSRQKESGCQATLSVAMFVKKQQEQEL